MAPQTVSEEERLRRLHEQIRRTLANRSTVVLDVEECRRRVREVKRRARGRWRELLLAAGVRELVLNGRNQPCPMCGGIDRFKFTDEHQDGEVYVDAGYRCTACGPGSALSLLMKAGRWPADTALRVLEAQLGIAADSPQQVQKRRGPSYDDMLRRMHAIWNAAGAIRPEDPADRYIRNQLGAGLDVYPASLRYHPELPYYEQRADGKGFDLVGHFPGLVAKMVGSVGEMAGVARIWLTPEGHRAPVPEPEKTMGPDYQGASVRFAEPTDDRLMVGVGVENSLAVFIRHGVATWAAVNARNLQHVWVPESIRQLWLYGDNDALAEFDEHVAVYLRAQQFMRAGSGDGRRAYPFFPPVPGSSWKSVFREANQRRRASQAVRLSA